MTGTIECECQLLFSWAEMSVWSRFNLHLNWTIKITDWLSSEQVCVCVCVCVCVRAWSPVRMDFQSLYIILLRYLGSRGTTEACRVACCSWPHLPEVLHGGNSCSCDRRPGGDTNHTIGPQHDLHTVSVQDTLAHLNRTRAYRILSGHRVQEPNRWT